MSNITYAPVSVPTLLQLIALNVVISTLTLAFWKGVGVLLSWI